MRPFVVLSLALFAGSAHAQLALRHSEVVEGAYTTVGNLLIDCPGAGSASCDNNDSVMVPVDVDGDPSTRMSSEATLSLPPAARVRTARLYVVEQASETIPANNGPRWIPTSSAAFTVKLAGPGGAYTTLIPSGVESLIGGIGYLARYEVTSLITSSGAYRVADALELPSTHRYNRIASWILFVTYDDGSPPRLVNLYDGALTCFQNTTTISLAGFRTPAATSPAALFTAWSIDGHPTINGESITVGTLQLSNAQNPVNNLGNSTVTSPSGAIPRRPSTFRVTEEMDLDTFDVSRAFTTSQTSVDVRLTCGAQEGVIYHAAVVAVEIVAPRLEVQKSVVDLNGGSALAGDDLEYTLTARVTGGDDAVAVVLRDALPGGLRFLPGSIAYGVGTAAPKTDAPGDDEAEWTGTELILRLGAGASSTAGGTLAVGLSEVVRFRATVQSTTVAATIVNRATLSARGAQSGSGATAVTVQSSSVAVDVLPCAGFSGGQCPDAGFVDAETPVDLGLADAETPVDLGLADAVPASDGGGLIEDVLPVDQGFADAAPLADRGVDAGVAIDASRPSPDASPATDAAAPGEGTEGCGCTTSTPGSSGVWLLGLAALMRGARRRG